MFVDSVDPVLTQYGRTELGPLVTDNGQTGYYFDIPDFDFSNAAFNISGQLTNLQSLPFVPSFTAANMVAGQNVGITSPTLSLVGEFTLPRTRSHWSRRPSMRPSCLRNRPAALRITQSRSLPMTYFRP